MGTRGRTRRPEARPGGEGGTRADRGRAERRRAARRAGRRRQRSLLREIPLIIVVALGITLLLQTFLVQVFSIPSGSMENTIAIGDRVAVDKLSPWFGEQPQRGEVVVFNDPDNWLKDDPVPQDGAVLGAIKGAFTFVGLLPSDRDLIKRVIGVPGDVVACCDSQGRVTVNGKPLTEPYIYPGNPPSRISFKVTVPPGDLWVMGDHRDISADSRFHLNSATGGFVPEKDVVGRAVAVIWPLSHWRTLPVQSIDATAADTGGPVRADQRVRQVSSGAGPGPVPGEPPLVMGVAATATASATWIRRRRTTQRTRAGRWPHSS
ncbi:signal peptidase I [Streptacidiphilus sp. EB129]|uniref:signal peptidase I n=1 Tax=Streptacidiphilus sp. EB129 TaxID=3156262 RepID=UPI0035180CC8